MAKSTELNKLYKSHSWEQVDFLSYGNSVQANKNNNLLATELRVSLNLIGGASGVCHFLAISGLALAWGRGRVCRGQGPRHGGSGEQNPVLIREARGGRRLLGIVSSRKAEKEQAKLGYFNLINDCTPLRVCFNNQDTLQQVDRMFAVNLHMSSGQAVNINNVGASRCSRALGGEAAGRTPTPQPPHPRPGSGGPSQRRKGVWEMKASSYL